MLFSNLEDKAAIGVIAICEVMGHWLIPCHRFAVRLSTRSRNIFPPVHGSRNTDISDVLVERDPATLLALATDLYPPRAVVELHDVVSAHSALAENTRVLSEH